MPYPETAEGMMVTDRKQWSTFKKQDFKLKKFGPRDIDVAIDCCSVCGSDIHTISGGWDEKFPTPICVGHEIIGRAVKVGDEVKEIKVGDRVGVGAQIGADLTCGNCEASQENYCPKMVDTYGGEWDDGTMSQGGYASHIRAHEYFTFKIPEGIETKDAAPMMCAGLTVYSPLVRLGCGKGKKVGICGIGGLGHFGLLFANALGAEVYAISHTKDKEDDAKKLGAHHFIYTGDENFAEPYQHKLDFIVNCADATDKFDISKYLSLLRVNGTFHMVGLPDNELPKMSAGVFVPNGCYMGASHIGNHQEMESMLKLAAEKKIKPWVETMQLSEENCKTAVERVKENDVRFRIAFTGFDKVFGKRD